MELVKATKSPPAVKLAKLQRLYRHRTIGSGPLVSQAATAPGAMWRSPALASVSRTLPSSRKRARPIAFFRRRSPFCFPARRIGAPSNSTRAFRDPCSSMRSRPSVDQHSVPGSPAHTRPAARTWLMGPGGQPSAPPRRRMNCSSDRIGHRSDGAAHCGRSGSTPVCTGPAIHARYIARQRRSPSPLGLSPRPRGRLLTYPR